MARWLPSKPGCQTGEQSQASVTAGGANLPCDGSIPFRYSPPSARGRGAAGLLNGVFIHPPVGGQPARPPVRAKHWESGAVGEVRMEGGWGKGKEEGRERREEDEEEGHQELGQALRRLHTGWVQTNTWGPRRRHS